ncbi:sensor histidine kinase [Rubrivirga sp. SAORIC476]|uniref:sensor histidine kinase n=1 Tax=Rubrivirga sp. SAORIC476 TaxID=1961794 RepID=UPI000BA95D08|nr:histidine kinase [Rubrivirga sp. SAORIC476]MBC14623.1 histidine kinase [Rhodothermaceae bacterium]
MTVPSTPLRPWSRRAEALAAVGFWLILGVLSVVRRAVGPWHPEGIPVGDVIETLAEYGFWALLTPVVFWVAARWGAERDTWLRRLSAQLLLGVALALLIEWVTRGVLRPLLSSPDAAGPPEGFEWTLGGAFQGLWFLDEFIIYLAVLAVGYTRHALLRLRERQIEAEHLLADRARLEAQLSEARLSALRMQLNPHFLFNTLNAVSALVERDPAGVRTMIARLSSLLRRVLDDDGAAEVPLRDEMAFLRDYLDVQRVRFQGRMEVEEAVASDLLDALVPPLLLQPLVENAVGHGIRSIEEGVGRIRLTGRRDGDRLVLTVEDNGPGLGGVADGQGGSGGVGLQNTRARLDALYGADGVLTLRDADGSGVIAEVALPYRQAPTSGDGVMTAVPRVSHA